MAEKTEKATPKKLRDARKKGQVAKSQDFPSAFTFVIVIFATLFSTGYLFKKLAGFILEMFSLIGTNVNLEYQAAGILLKAIETIALSSFPILVMVVFTGVLVNFLIIGPTFSLQAMKFEFKKLNPIEGIKQKFKLKVFIELLKSMFKITGAGIIIYLIIMKTLPQVIMASSLPVYGSALILYDFLKKVSIQVGIFFLAIAIFDLTFQKRTFAKEMMMEKFELKQEYKDTEGDPQIKGKRKEIFKEMAYSEGMPSVKNAKAIITNPEHIAVAVGYEQKKDPVPTILMMGKGIIAEKIVVIANDKNIPIMRNVDLARQLFKMGRISDYIPEETYQPVAEILKWLEYMEEQKEVNVELFK